MTLTEMLEQQNNHRPLTTEIVKDVFKKWLEEVGLPSYQTPGKHGNCFDATKSLRDLIIILVDEPSYSENERFENERFERGT
ncbi:hypothetical protein LCGC14_1436980 [marine sediment metagenome]|uniref:Uncharacterized protein n=1 Tax=marine sediment metagenome TaxID=412755 RepID=A0A0F9JMF2_9ZZZZ